LSMLSVVINISNATSDGFDWFVIFVDILVCKLFCICWFGMNWAGGLMNWGNWGPPGIAGEICLGGSIYGCWKKGDARVCLTRIGDYYDMFDINSC
jgi:hypothetical protein